MKAEKLHLLAVQGCHYTDDNMFMYRALFNFLYSPEKSKTLVFPYPLHVKY